MRKLALVLVTVTVLVGGFLAVRFYYENLRGIGPAVKPPTGDIADLNETGFSISVFAEGLVAPRVMTYDPGGHIIASITSEGKIVVLPDRNGDGKSDETIVLLDGLNRPHGLAVRCTERCELYVAEEDKVTVYDYRYNEPEKIHRPVNGRKIIDLPNGGGHFTRTILFMPEPNDHKILVSVGSSCNVCQESDWRRAKLLIANADGSELREYARGLRNAVFMAIHPVSGEIWVTEMGRDFLGDDLPPDELNVIEEGGWYGWPWFYGNNIEDRSWTTAIPGFALEPAPSHIDIPAHSAPLGLAFIPEEGWPEDWWYDLIVAYHGSWNRSEPTGYKLVRIKLDAEGNYEGTEDFITGWLRGNEAPGRPVDILIQPGGVMYVSDDKAGVIYKIAWQGEEAGSGDKSDLIRVENIKPGDLVKSPLVIRGEARGYWFFEASFPVRLIDENGVNIPLNPPYIMTSGEWMTTDFVPFEATLEFEAPETERGTFILEKDNPSGLPENADSLSIPVRFR